MQLSIGWEDLALRLALTLLASALIGFDRGVKGHAAGIRTTILVGLAASAAMLQANILLPVAGKTPSSFGTMDLMRLPLGILTGVGFIGGGAIVKRGDLVTGITTAATLWVTTVIGLCFGGGQLVLGIVVTALSTGILSILGWLDQRIPRRQRGLLVIDSEAHEEAKHKLESLLQPLGYHLRLHKLTRIEGTQRQRLWFEMTWERAEVAGLPQDLLRLLEKLTTIVQFEMMSEVGHSHS